jgi:hypothetical protein
MPQTEFSTCPKCGKGKLVPTGKVTSSPDPDTGKETAGKEYKCDDCGYIEVGHDRTFEVNEQLIITDSPSPPPPADDNKRNKDNSNNSGGGNGASGGVPPAASSSSGSYPNELNNRVHFKLNAARRHLDNLIRLEDDARSLAAPSVRIEAKQGIDECLCHLVGVKDALLQEVNAQLNLGIPPRNVKRETVNPELDTRGADARDIIAEIRSMESNQNDQRWRINELHNRSEHRDLIGQALLIVDGRLERHHLLTREPAKGW